MTDEQFKQLLEALERQHMELLEKFQAVIDGLIDIEDGIEKNYRN